MRRSITKIQSTPLLFNSPIGTILEHPEAYHLQIVHMEGIVQQLELLKPHEPFQPGDPCYGAYTFRLQDETGAIMVGVPGHKLNCGRLTGDESPGVTDGDRVMVVGRIHAPGQYVDKIVSPLPRGHTVTEVVGLTISRLGH